MTSLELTLTLAGPLALALAAALGVLAATRLRGRLRAFAIAAAIGLLPPGIYATGMRYRVPTEARERVLAPGIAYARIVDPEGPAVLHVVRIDLRRPDLIPVATPPAPGKAVPAQRVLDFATEHNAEVAINTAFFHPFHSTTPLDYYPRTGDPTEPFGLTITDGESFGANRFHHGTVYLDEDRASLEPLPDTRWAVTGRTVLVRDGEAIPNEEKALAPRSVIASDGDRLWFVVVDGRQPGYSVGMRLGTLAERLASMGAQWAVEMDGGGSSTLATTTGPEPRVLNCPIHTRLPCRARPVAAQLGVRRVR